MSIVYEHRHLLQSDPYPPGISHDSPGDHSDHDGNSPSANHDHGHRHSHSPIPYSPTSAIHNLAPFNTTDDPTLNTPLIGSSPESTNFLAPPTPPELLPSADGTDLDREQQPKRSRPIAKPARQATKNAAGKFVCTFAGCTDVVKEFVRKCEWSKHMDKHTRPYKCGFSGCEKLPGFTYSGGLLRHEREVHGEHGGPRNPLNCPHLNCKRHMGKGFTRLENLNEHLRRVHTPSSSDAAAFDEPEEDTGALSLASATSTPTPTPAPVSTEHVGGKRKAQTDLRDEVVKRLQVENRDLRNQVEAQKRHQIAMMKRVKMLEDALQPFTDAGRLGNQATSASPAAPLLNGGAEAHQSL
ncbi:hypothetical protein F5B20DRAFT_535784 [Whalleya microplaca]|nr:hypothetical protein F5B20DRAFT_535784 [Whalleya microplaca]